MSPAHRGSSAALAAIVLLLAAAPASANHGTNAFSGMWATSTSGKGGNVSFRVVDATQGAQELSNIGGAACSQPTTYYHGDYTDGTNTGVMAACTVGSTRLVGRYSAPAGKGGFDITLGSGGTSFSGSNTADDFPGFVGPYSGTFTSHFAGDGCCPQAAPNTPTQPQQTPASLPRCSFPGAGARGVFPGPAPSCKTDEDKRRWTRLSIQYNEDAAEYCIAAALFTGGALVPGLQIASGVPATGFALMCALAWKNSAAYARWANDPPDPNYQAVAAPATTAVPRLLARRGVSTRAANAFNALTRNLADQAALTDAVRHAFERAQGAAQAGDAASEAIQEAAAARYAQELENVIRQRRALALSARSAFTSSGFPTIRFTTANARRGQRLVRTQGFPSGIRRILSSVLTASEQAGLRAAASRQSSAVAGTFPGHLATTGLKAAEPGAALSFHVFASKLTPTANTFSGTWTTKWSTGGSATMTLTQSGSAVTGTYTHDSGQIQGTVTGGVLSGTWSEAPTRQPDADAGEITFTLSADGHSFTGAWHYGSSGATYGWNGTCTAGDCLKNG